MKIECHFNESRWRVSAPNGHYRECAHTCHLSETIEKVIADYADWLVKLTNMDHLDIVITDHNLARRQ